MKLGQGLALLGLHYPVCNLRFPCAHLEGGSPAQDTWKLLPALSWSWFGGNASFLGPLLKGAQELSSPCHLAH